MSHVESRSQKKIRSLYQGHRNSPWMQWVWGRGEGVCIFRVTAPSQTQIGCQMEAKEKVVCGFRRSPSCSGVQDDDAKVPDFT